MRLRTLTRGLPLVLALMMCACASTPKKYRKKRGCDCPHWNHVPAKAAKAAPERA
jgi:starvation-inducible outer membrane lipoprotein